MSIFDDNLRKCNCLLSISIYSTKNRFPCYTVSETMVTISSGISETASP